MDTIKKPACDMHTECATAITHIDRDGYTYCEAHGVQRRRYVPCRKLTSAEHKRLARGEKIARY